MRRQPTSAGRGMAALVAAIGLAACGGAKSTSSSASSTSSATSSVTTDSSSVHTLPIPTFALPSKAAGCRGATPAGGSARRIPVRVSKVGPDVGIVVNVCIEGKGPFPFALDTGAASAAITTALADRLKLPKVGKLEEISGAGCTATAQERRIAAWSVGGVPLHGQTITAQTLPRFGEPGQPDGLIGSDVWSAFGAIRIDYRHGDVIVPGAERAFPTREVLIKKPSTSPLPGSLARGHPRVVAPMAVDETPTQTLMLVKVAFDGHGAYDFTPDTGASSSVVDSGVASQDGLSPTNVRARQNTVCSIITAPKVRSGAWSLAGHSLVPQSLAAVKLLPSGPSAGLLGSDQMADFGSVVFDYRGGRLVLGAG